MYNDPDGHCGALCGIVIAGYVALDVAVAVALADVVDSHGWAYEPEYHKQYIEQTASRHSVVLPPTALGAALGVQAEGQIWAADVGQAMFKGLFGDLLHMGNTASVGPAQMRPGEYNSHDTWTLLNNHEAGIEALAAKMAAADQEFMLTSEAYNYKSSMTDHMIVLAIGQNSGPFGAQSLFGNYYKSGRIDWAAWFAGDDRNAAAQTCPGNCRGWADYQRLHMGGLRSNLNSFLQQLNELTEYGWQLPEGVDWDELDRLAGGSK